MVSIKNNELANWLFIMHNNGIDTQVFHNEDDVKKWIQVRCFDKGGKWIGGATFDGITHEELNPAEFNNLNNKEV